MRAEDFELTLRLEARDLSLYFEFEQQVCTLPLRTGARCAGAVQATIIQPNQLKVTWSTDNGREHCSQVIGIAEFKSKDNSVYRCMQCEPCSRWRKQMFLIGSGKDGSPHYRFVCQWCANLEINTKRRSKRQNRTST